MYFVLKLIDEHHECADHASIDKCTKMKATGYCQTHSNWAYNVCRKTCGDCGKCHSKYVQF